MSKKLLLQFQLGVVNSTLAAIDLLRRDKGGSGGVIINLASEAGLTSAPTLPIYSGTKHAVTGFTRSLANETFLKKTGISFLTICPSYVDSSMAKNYRDKFMFLDIFSDSEKVLKLQQEQPASVIGDCVIRALKDGENGAVWACSPNAIRKVKLPEYPNLEDAQILNENK